MNKVKSIFIKLYLTVIFSYLINIGFAQFSINKTLEPLLAGKTKLSEIMPVVNRFYNTQKESEKEEFDSEYEHWMRWAWYQSRHLDSNGNFVNSNEKNYTVISQIQKQKVNTNLSNRPDATSGSWSFYGPEILGSGIARVDRLAFHPTDPNIIYAGTPAGGLWITYNGGTSWSSVSSYIANLGVSGITVDADNPNTIYVLTGDGDTFANGGLYIQKSIGLLKSTDGGVSWAKLSNILPEGIPYYGFKLLQHPDFHNVFFACTSEGLYRSTNYGQTWNRMIDVINTFDIETGPSGYIYVSGKNFIFISSNFGNTFSSVPNAAFSQPPNIYTQRTSLAVTPNSPNTLYVNFGGSYPNGQEHLLYRSDNNGATFTLINNNCPLTSGYTNSMAVNPANVNNVIIGNVDLNTSTNGGASFNTGSPGVHADIHDLVYNPINNVLYAGCDGGVYKSTNNGANWVAIHNGIRATMYYHMAGFEGNDGIAMGGAQDNGMHSRTFSTAYTLASNGDGFDAKYLTGNSNAAYFSLNAGVYKYTVNTNTAQLKLLPGGDINNQSVFFPSIAVHPTNNNIIYAGYTDSVRRTDNDGATWIATPAIGSNGFGFSGGLAVSVQQPDRIYAASGSRLRISNNKGTNWTIISDNPGWTTSNPITDVTTRSNNGDEVWVTFGGYNGAKVYYSSNAGASWADYSGSLPDLPVYSIKYSSQGDAYIGTEAGVYFMDFAMTDWVSFSNGLPMVPVTEIVINETNNTIKAATYGRGMWLSSAYSDCVPSLVLSGTTQGTNTWQSSATIETTELIPGSLGNDVKYRSQKITLQPGYKALNGSYMHAIVGPCGQGVLNKVKAQPKKYFNN
jgi:hypothetical protein